MRLEDVSSTTKIRLSYLEAMEHDHLDELPGGVIGRGFVRAYARAVGVDEEETVASYVANRAESEAPLILLQPQTSAMRPRSFAATLPSWSFVAGFLAIGIGFVILGIFRNQYLAYVDSSATQTVSAGSSAASSPQEANESSPAEGSSIRRGVVPQNVSASHIQQQAASAIPSPASAAVPSAAETDALTLEIIVRQDAWLSIVADGRHIVTDTLVAPTKRIVKAHKEILIRAGNIGGVDFSFNGKELPSQGGYGEARTLRFDANGLMPPTQNVASPSLPTDRAVPSIATPQTSQD